MKLMSKTLLVVLIVFSATVAFARQGMFGPDDEMRQLHEDISANLLLQTLNLTDDQKAEIKSLIDTVRPDMLAAKKKAEKFRDDEMKPYLKSVLGDVKSGKEPGDPPEAISQSMDEFRTEHMDLKLRAGEVMEKVMALLNDDQKQALRDFKPLNKLGMKGGRGKGMMGFGDPQDMMEHVRSMSDEQFNRLVAHLEKKSQRKQARNKGNNNQGVRRVDQLIELMKQVRAMDESEYQAKLEDLKKQAEEIGPGQRRGGKGGMNMNRRGQGKRGMGQGPGDCMGPGGGNCMGQGMGPGMGQGMGPGKGFGGHHGKGGMHKFGRLVFSEAFYNAL